MATAGGPIISHYINLHCVRASQNTLTVWLIGIFHRMYDHAGDGVSSLEIDQPPG